MRQSYLSLPKEAQETLRRDFWPDTRQFERYQSDPNGYAREHLRQVWWEKQVEVAEALVSHKKVGVQASHAVGKSHVAAGLVNWFFDCYNPSIVLTTAPNYEQVVDVLWGQVRLQRPSGTYLQPKAPRMESSPSHFAAGYTARDSNAFQGRHEERLFIIFDEADGIDGQFFDAAEGMVTGPDNRWLAIYNPTESGSRMEQEEVSGDWHLINISALEHPNIIAQLQGLPKPYPKAVSLEWVEERVKRWCTPLIDNPKATDLEWPPGSGIWYRPGPLFESRVLGRRPGQGVDSVWSDAHWAACLKRQPEPDEPVIIGCDVARFGDDMTCMMVRRGNVLLHTESHNGWGTDETAGRLKELAREYGRRAGQEPQSVQCNVDDDGVGGGVYDQRGDFTFVRCSGAAKPLSEEEYPNRRSEIWFAVADRAAEGRVDVSSLDDTQRSELKRQLKAPKWKLDNQGRRVVERKDETKKRLKRSPDDADAFNLCFGGAPPAASVRVEPERDWMAYDRSEGVNPWR